MLPLPHPSSPLAATKGTGPGSREGHNPMSVSHHLFKYSPSPPCSPPVLSTHHASPNPLVSPWFETHFLFCSDNYFPLPADAQVKSTTCHRKKKLKTEALGVWGDGAEEQDSDIKSPEVGRSFPQNPREHHTVGKA